MNNRSLFHLALKVADQRLKMTDKLLHQIRLNSVRYNKSADNQLITAVRLSKLLPKHATQLL